MCSLARPHEQDTRVKTLPRICRLAGLRESAYVRGLALGIQDRCFNPRVDSLPDNNIAIEIHSGNWPWRVAVVCGTKLSSYRGGTESFP